MKSPGRVIVVLAGGLQADGIPNRATRVRLDLALRYYSAGFAQQIIVSGGGPHMGAHDGPATEITEAEAMRRSLLASGVEPGAVLKEEHSMETIGNLYYTRTELLDHRPWRVPLIITSRFHIPRVMAIADWVLGDDFLPVFAGAKDGASADPAREEIERTLCQHFLDNVVPLVSRGQIEAIGQALFSRKSRLGSRA